MGLNTLQLRINKHNGVFSPFLAAILNCVWTFANTSCFHKDVCSLFLSNLNTFQRSKGKNQNTKAFFYDISFLLILLLREIGTLPVCTTCAFTKLYNS